MLGAESNLVQFRLIKFKAINVLYSHIIHPFTLYIHVVHKEIITGFMDVVKKYSTLKTGFNFAHPY